MSNFFPIFEPVFPRTVRAVAVLIARGKSPILNNSSAVFAKIEGVYLLSGKLVVYFNALLIFFCCHCFCSAPLRLFWMAG